MKKKPLIYMLLAMLSFTYYSCSTSKNHEYSIAKNYKPDDPELYKTIVGLDSIFFNTCDLNLEKYGDFYSDNIEFYHDQGGIMTSKKDIIEGTKKNICGKVTRELVKGSIEVYPIKNFGAIEIGLHKFHNNTEPANAKSQVGRFMIIWKNDNNQWKITRVVSLH